MEISHLTQSSAAPVPIIFQPAERVEGEFVFAYVDVQTVCERGARRRPNGRHVAVPLCWLAGHSACLGVGEPGRVGGRGGC